MGAHSRWRPAGAHRAARAWSEAHGRVERERYVRAHLARIGLDRYVDYALDSYDEQVEKPDPRLFEIALERSGARKESTIHVGDLYNIDIVGARNAGLRAVLVDEAGLRLDADCPRVQSLSELVARIGDGEFD